MFRRSNPEDDWLELDDLLDETTPRRRRFGWLAVLLFLALMFALSWFALTRIMQPDTVSITENAVGTIAIFNPLATATPDVDFPIPQLQQKMLTLINQDRTAVGLAPVKWDDTLELAGTQHAIEMVQDDYFSHWNLQGLGPDHRYSLSGGRFIAAENLHSFEYTFTDGTGAPIEDWDVVIENAQTGLMNSRGHRENILNPSHTHVGIGMAYDAEKGVFRLAQEFGNQHAHVTTPLPIQATLGEEVVVTGQLQNAEATNILLDLAYEPFPDAMSIEQLSQTSTYRSRAISAETRRIPQTFQETVTLNVANQLGIYHIRIFADLNNQQSQLINHTIWVTE